MTFIPKQNSLSVNANARGCGVLLGFVVLLSACGGGSSSTPFSPPPFNGSTPTLFLSITANPLSQPPPTPQDITAAIDLAYNAGVRGQYQFATWSSLEPQSGTYNLQDLMAGINFLIGRGFQRLLVTVAPINTTTKETPPDLLAVPFNSQQTKTRFHALLDALVPQLPTSVVYLSIGNEVDIYLNAHPAEWAAYQEFYEDSVSYIHQKWPRLKVGVTVTFSGAMGAPAVNVSALSAKSDVWVFTYYPVGLNFQPLGPQSPSTDFPLMGTLSGGRPIVLQEVGYPSSALLGSSESEQAAFVSSVFQSWLARGDQMPYLNYFLLHDFSDAACDEFTAYYGAPSDPNFHEFLCTLGLRRVDGSPKPGWQTFVDRATAGGFPK
jgi:hypothetical protein